MIIGTKSRLWLRWVAANSLAELIGLGTTFALDILILARVAAASSALASLAGIVLMAATGAIEGTVVGLFRGRITNDDMACGSGGFLLRAYDVLAEFYRIEIARLERERTERLHQDTIQQALASRPFVPE